MFDGGVNACEELFVDVHADGGGLEGLADVDVVETGFGFEHGGVYLFKAVADAAEAAADEAHEGAGHAGEEDEEGEGGCCFDWVGFLLEG